MTEKQCYCSDLLHKSNWINISWLSYAVSTITIWRNCITTTIKLRMIHTVKLIKYDDFFQSVIQNQVSSMCSKSPIVSNTSRVKRRAIPKECPLTHTGKPIMKITICCDYIISTIGSLTLVMQHLYIEWGLRFVDWCKASECFLPCWESTFLCIITTSAPPRGLVGSGLVESLIARFMGQHGAHLGPTGPRQAPCWPHEPCYLGWDPL